VHYHYYYYLYYFKIVGIYGSVGCMDAPLKMYSPLASVSRTQLVTSKV